MKTPRPTSKIRTAKMTTATGDKAKARRMEARAMTVWRHHDFATHNSAFISGRVPFLDWCRAITGQHCKEGTPCEVMEHPVSGLVAVGRC